jgi:hypothetical protein
MNEVTPSIVEQLMSKLTDIKDKLKGGNIDAFVFLIVQIHLADYWVSHIFLLK